jgi:hypothetical protein
MTIIFICSNVWHDSSFYANFWSPSPCVWRFLTYYDVYLQKWLRNRLDKKWNHNLASILENWRQKIKIGDFFGSNIFGAIATTDYGIYFLQKQVPVENGLKLIQNRNH